MGRIKKVAGPKHEATLSPALSEFVSASTRLPLGKIPAHLRSFPFRWPYPRGDLYHWIPLLDFFDEILEEFLGAYGLKDGPQTKSFASTLLHAGLPNRDGSGMPSEELYKLDFGKEGDRELVESILSFSRLLLENCGNRSLYASSDRLGYLLNSASLTLTSTTLRLACRLAIRYLHSRMRGPGSNQFLSSAMLASHYNISLDKVQKLADPFVKAGASVSTSPGSNTALSPSKGKERTSDSPESVHPSVFNGSDMFAAARADVHETDASHGHDISADSISFEEWGDVNFSYYQSSPPQGLETNPSSPLAQMGSVASAPSTPTPVRRSSALSRPSRLSGVEALPPAPSPSSVAKTEGNASSGVKTLFISRDELSRTRVEDILREKLSSIPKEFHYDLLVRVRTAKALIGSPITRRQVVSVRILALTNLAYVYPELLFQPKVLQQDSDEPRHLQIVQQLADLVHPPNNGKAGIPLELKTIALGALEALSKHKSRAADVCAALSVNVSHGVLLYILRKTAADLATEGSDENNPRVDEWQEALLSLLDALPGAASRTAESLVGAGLLDILVDVLKLRTDKAERIHHKVLTFLSTLVNGVRDAFQAFVNCKGLDVISDLIAWEVSSSIDRVGKGLGLPDKFKSQVTDYRMPYFQQQTLRWLFKFVNHMMTHGNANFDRLLRNLIDSPPLLKGLRDVLGNSKIFGSTIWSGAVNILSSFIHNEPTSYAVIAEAGLSKALLESISLKQIEIAPSPEPASDVPKATVITKTEFVDAVRLTSRRGVMPNYHVEKEEIVGVYRSKSEVLADGILPATDAINAIPPAFGAICLNTGGLDLFLSSGALETFFEVFESQDHVKSMAAEANLPKTLGQHFDELVRHHPKLKSAVMSAVVLMLARVNCLCKSRAWEKGYGAKLWVQDGDGKLSVSGGKDALPGSAGKLRFRSHTPSRDEDVFMEESSSVLSTEGSSALDQVAPPHVSTYVGVVSKFLSGFFDNQSLCGAFVQHGGLEFLLDLATSPSLPHDFNNHHDSHDLSHILHLLVEHKPHLVLPSIVTRTMQKLEVLEPLMGHSEDTAFFDSFTRDPLSRPAETSPDLTVDGTTIIKALVSVHTLCNVLHETFLHPPYGSRSNHTLFSQFNLTDRYVVLVKALGRLYRVCVWEEIQLQNSISNDLKWTTRINGYGMGSDEADEIFGFIPGSEAAGYYNNATSAPAPTTGTEDTTDVTNGISQSGAAHIDSAVVADRGSKSQNAAHRKNVQSLRFLLSQIPSSITPFLQGLGRALVPKRRIDAYQRQNAYIVADALAEAALDHLRYERAKSCADERDRYAYWIVAVTSLSQLLIEGPMERPHAQCLTLVLQAFMNHGGLKFTNELLQLFFRPLADQKNEDPLPSNTRGLVSCLYGGMKLLLVFYTQITSHKFVVESTQSHTLTTPERERDSAYYFNPAQFLVELRVSVLSAVQPIWDSSLIDESSSSILKCLIDILRSVLEADQEHAAHTAGSGVRPRPKPEFRTYTINAEKHSSLRGRGIPFEMAREALYRCMNGREASEEYCDAHIKQMGLPGLPVPPYDIEMKHNAPPPPELRRQGSEDTIPDAESMSQTERTEEASVASPAVSPTLLALPDEHTSPPAAQASAADTDVGDGMAMSIDNLLRLNETPVSTGPLDPPPAEGYLAPVPFRIVDSQSQEQVTIETLDKIRAELRKNLVDRVLDLLSSHDDLTFELSDLIITAVSKAPDAVSLRKEIGETLVQSLISFQLQDGGTPTEKKVGSYANLLALVIQDKDFYAATLDELKENFAQLLEFIKVSPDPAPEESSPWIGQVLLIIEKLLSEDAQPQQIKWTPPSADSSRIEDSVAEMDAPVVSREAKLSLFHSITHILPRVGRDKSLGLSLVRVLVILTREREIADCLAEKHNLQRLFVMVKQLAGVSNEKFQNCFLIVLRHIMEDDETIKNVMRSEIIASFQSRPARPIDTAVYIRSMHGLVLRAPKLFLEVTNEKLKLHSFDPNLRAQALVLKEETVDSTSSPAKPSDSTGLPLEESSQAEGEIDSSVLEVAKPTTEDANVNDVVGDKAKSVEAKFPVLEHPDGVIHYLLSQLLVYKDVDDKDAGADPKTPTKEAAPAFPADVEMDTNPTPLPVSANQNEEQKKTEKAEYKAEHHPIYIYRCFLLQCLSELLMSYSRAKVEFINFSRKTESKSATTPSKPRSGILNYMLQTLIPFTTLERTDTVAFRKNFGTSNWAMSAIVSLCLKTNENGPLEKRELADEGPDPDLLFIRKFVLEQALKAFRDAQASNDSLDTKYARLLSYSDLFGRLLNGRVLPNTPAFAAEGSGYTIKEIAKCMFEKNFIAALTGAIADVDLNFPNAKRTVKYMLRPLKVLTQTAIHLSETSDLSTTPGQIDDDEISTATSVSDVDDSREETPDLFRHSTLGILDPGREDVSSSESVDEDEDMYDDEYDDTLEYEEEEMERDNDEVVSDEDEELDDAGPVEGLSGDVGMDVEIVIGGDDEDDEATDEDDSEDSDDMDEDDDGEVIDEITGDDNDSLGDDHGIDWDDEDVVGEHLFGQDQVGPPLYVRDHPGFQLHAGQEPIHSHQEELDGHAVLNDGPRAPGGAVGDLEMDVHDGRYMEDLDLELAPEDEDAPDEDEDEDVDVDDEDVMYPDYDELEEQIAMPIPPPWGWGAEDEPPMPAPRGHHHHHHSHVRRLLNPWSLLTPGEAGTDRVSNYRHRLGTTAAGVRGPEDGINPLLRRSGSANDTPLGNRIGIVGDASGTSLGDWVHMIHPRHRDGTVSLINGMMSAVGAVAPLDVPPGAWPPGSLHLHFGGHGGFIPIPRDIQRLISSNRVGTNNQIRSDPNRPVREDHSMVPFFFPSLTQPRWIEEARLLFGVSFNEKTQRVVNSILKLLVPPAMEEERIKKQKNAEAAEAMRKHKEEAKAKEERLAKEKAEREAREQEEKEAREAAERATAEQHAQAIGDEPPDTDAMEGILSTGANATTSATGPIEPDGTAEAANAAPLNEPERVRATFRGREYDITHLGIDLEYLDALPEELREEVLMQQLAEQRSQAAVSGEVPTDISREFLDALPADIREEILQQEAQDRRRRERSEARRQAAAAGGPASARAEEMDTASFLASLDPVLRNAVLLEQDDAMIAQLPAAIAAEARALGADRVMHRWGDVANRANRPTTVRQTREEQAVQTKKTAKKAIVQMLDKAGVATLLRLLFVSQQGSSRASLNQILQNASENRQNRGEILNILLSILQEGSVDVNAIERSFMHLSLRAKQRDSTQKTPQPLKRTLTAGQTTAPLNSEMTPLMVIQQCLSTLVHLTETNPHVPAFFLAEHDSPANVRNKSSRKGKVKDTRESRYPLNALLSLLDRKMIMESATCMEQLSSLMQSVSQPLAVFRVHRDRLLDSSALQQTEQTVTEAQSESAAQHPHDTATQELTNTEPTAAIAGASEASPENDTADKDENEQGSAEPAKKQREPAKPIIPDYNLRLVVNILAARECSGKTFRDTLSTINNLSVIPGAKDVFGKELIKQAQDLGETITQDLDFLLSQIQGADTSHEVHGIALSKFSPSSSDQAKLLRVLTALDYLFDPKRSDGKATGSGEAPQEDTAKETVVSTLYESSTFGPLWAKLSDCLRYMRQRDDMLNTATILLPLVEALMVVCKNTALKETAIKVSKDFSVTSPVPESSMDGLFFRFTEEHRKILNDLVRNNPRLMSGTFSLLVKNPKVLEFDNKRNYFTRRLHSRTEVRHPQAPLQLSIRREQTFLDSYKSLYFKSPEEIKYGKLSIRFHGEEGVDAGGVTREWFQTMSRQMFNPDYYLFVPVTSDRTTFHPNRLSRINGEHLFYFKFIGRIIGKALYEGRALDCHFSRAVYKRILGKSVSVKDMETLDLDYYKSLLWMLENDISDIITETFSIESQAFDVSEVIDLIENGRNIPVTEENKQEYVQLVVEYRLTGSVQAQLEEFLKGFHDIVPADLISIFNEQELELLISGLPDIDVDDWKNNTEYHNYSASSVQIQWFWRAVRSFDKEERAKLLQFVTGTAKVPLNGFKELEGMNGFSRFNIHRDYGNKKRLPSSHTCFNQLDLPEYEDYETLRQQVYTAVTAGSEYFGFA